MVHPIARAVVSWPAPMKVMMLSAISLDVSPSGPSVRSSRVRKSSGAPAGSRARRCFRISIVSATMRRKKAMVLRPRQRVMRGSQSGARSRSSGSTRPMVSNKRSISRSKSPGWPAISPENSVSARIS